MGASEFVLVMYTVYIKEKCPIVWISVRTEFRIVVDTTRSCSEYQCNGYTKYRYLGFEYVISIYNIYIYIYISGMGFTYIGIYAQRIQIKGMSAFFIDKCAIISSLSE